MWLGNVVIICCWVLLGLTLVSAPHLSRSYHHLFPLEPFREVVVEDKRNRFVLLAFFITIYNSVVCFGVVLFSIMS